MQVVSVCFSFKVKFPKEFLDFYRWIASFVDFDFIELSSPECTVGGLSYEKRWVLGAISPLVAMLPFVLLGYLDETRRYQSTVTVIVVASASYV
jgi:hypothetical protein